MNRFSLFFPILLCLIVGCKSTKYTAKDLPQNQVLIGNGGGFSGIQTEYILLENGQLFERSSMRDSLVELKGVSKKAAQKIFEQIRTLGMDTMNYNQPGNLYKYLSYSTPFKDYRITWGAQDTVPGKSITSFYEKTYEMINKQKTNEQ